MNKGDIHINFIKWEAVFRQYQCPLNSLFFSIRHVKVKELLTMKPQIIYHKTHCHKTKQQTSKMQA